MKNPSDSDKVYVVTGPTSGIGKGIVRALARPGNRIVLVARDAAKLAELARSAEGKGARAEVVPCDLSDLHAVRAAARTIVQHLDGGALVGLVNNAGLQQRQPTQTSRGVDMTFAVNFLAPLVLTDALLPAFATGARVVFLGSGTEDPDDPLATRFGFRGGRYLSAEDSAAGRWAPGGSPIPGQDAYTTSKLCCVLLARQLGREVSPERISFVAFDPGLVPGTGLGREASAALRFGWNYVLPVLARVMPHWSTPGRAGRVVNRLLNDSSESIPSGTYVDDGGRPKAGSVMTRDERLAARVLGEGRALAARLLAEPTLLHAAHAAARGQ